MNDENTNIKFLLDEVSKYPELYNAIAKDLWIQFGMQNAEITLLVTYMIHKYVERWTDGSYIFL